jgi:serine/threonine-protein kinase
LINPRLRLVRPVMDASADDVWVADHLDLNIQVAVAFAGLGAAPEPARSADGRSRPSAPQGGADSTGVDLAAAEQRFSLQARLRSAVEDPHLVQIFEHGTAKAGVPFLVTELLEGKCLRQRITHGGPLSLLEAEAVVVQTAGALAKAHVLQLAHGSICPDNLFLLHAAGQPFVKIQSFGATEAPASAAADMGVNHPYLSPAQLLLAAGHDRESDLWALAVTLYELLTTTLPFEAPTSAGLSVAICNAQFSPPSHYRADLAGPIDAWFARALAREPLDRFADAAELAHGFTLALRGAALARAELRSSESLSADLEDEEEEDQEDERTMKWDLPRDWASSVASARSPVPSPRLPGSGPPPLPNTSLDYPVSASTRPAAEARFPSSQPASPLFQPASPLFQPASPLSQPASPLSQPASPLSQLASPLFRPASPLSQPPSPALSQKSQLASLAAAFSTGVARAAPSGPLSPHRTPARRPSPRWWAAVSVTGTFVLLFSLYQSVAPDIAGPGAVEGEAELSPTRSSTSALSPDGHKTRVAESTRANARTSLQPSDPAELPEIITSDDLPTAPDEIDEDAIADGEGMRAPPASAANGNPLRDRSLREVLTPPPARAPAAATPRVNVSGNLSAPAQSPIQKVAPAPPAAPAPRAAPAVAKRAKLISSCNPPYYVDSANIKRLKLECL